MNYNNKKLSKNIDIDYSKEYSEIEDKLESINREIIAIEKKKTFVYVLAMFIGVIQIIFMPKQPSRFTACMWVIIAMVYNTLYIKISNLHYKKYKK